MTYFLTRSFVVALIILPATLLLANGASAQSLDDNEGAVEVPSSGSYSEMPEKGAKPANGVVGRKAAEKYMGNHADSPSQKNAVDVEPRVHANSSDNGPRGANAHYLSIEFGSFISDNAYGWGNPSAQTNVGRWRAGVTYRIGEWLNSMDLAAKIMLDNYSLNDGYAKELSFLPVIMFPDANSHFPLYFGGGLGPGIFLQPIPTRPSVLSIDYTLFAGVRFFDLYRSVGGFIEAGLKNHFLLLTDGQFNGYFISVGAIFTF